MSAFRRFARWHRNWCPLWLWPMALVLLVAAFWAALMEGDYARGTFNFLLARALDAAATRSAKKAFREASDA